MAVTTGQGNPAWTEDETILALNLYFELNGKVPGADNHKVKELSHTLRGLPLYPVEARKDNFGNSDGVAFKLQNIHSIRTGTGLKNVSKMDRYVYEQFGDDRDQLRQLSEQILSAGREFNASEALVEQNDDQTFLEGQIITASHKRRERSPRLRQTVIREQKKLGPLACEICGCGSRWKKLVPEEATFECHHRRLFADSGRRQTRTNEVALLCASCHRAIHAYIGKSGQWISPEDFKSKLHSDA